MLCPHKNPQTWDMETAWLLIQLMEPVRPIMPPRLMVHTSTTARTAPRRQPRPQCQALRRLASWLPFRGARRRALCTRFVVLPRPLDWWSGLPLPEGLLPLEAHGVLRTNMARQALAHPATGPPRLKEQRAGSSGAPRATADARGTLLAREHREMRAESGSGASRSCRELNRFRQAPRTDRPRTLH